MFCAAGGKNIHPALTASSLLSLRSIWMKKNKGRAARRFSLYSASLCTRLWFVHSQMPEERWQGSSPSVSFTVSLRRWKDDDFLQRRQPGLEFHRGVLALLSAECQQIDFQHPYSCCQMDFLHYRQRSLSQIAIKLILVLTDCVRPARCSECRSQMKSK